MPVHLSIGVLMNKFRLPKITHESVRSNDCSWEDMDEEDARDKSLDILDRLGTSPLEDESGGWIRFPCPLGHRRGDPANRAGLHYRGGGLPSFNCLGQHGGMRVVDFLIGAGLFKTPAESMVYLLDGVRLTNRPRTPPVPAVPVRHPMSRLDSWPEIPPYLTEERGISEANCRKHHACWHPACDYVVIPVFDEVGDGCFPGWQERYLEPGHDPKYRSSKGLPKSLLLYNGSVKSPVTVLVESPISCIAKSHLDAGYGFVATMGGEPSSTQLKLLAKRAPLVLWFDNDERGLDFTYETGDSLRARFWRTDFLVVENPDPSRKDVDLFSDDETLALLEAAVSLEEWERLHPDVVERSKLAAREWSLENRRRGR